MDDESRIAHYVEMWKQTVTVQQHFNDIEWRIRGLALTALTFALGAAVIAARDQTAIKIFAWTVQLSSTVLTLGLFLWWAFYFVDQIWYHRLLIGAVQHGEALETVLREQLPEAGLTHQISASSQYPVRLGWGKARIHFKRPLRSRMKLRLFYAFGSFALILPAVALQLGA